MTLRNLNYWAPHVTVAAIVEKSNTFLMVEEMIAGRKVITQPAGHLDEGENLVDAVRREVLEETGLTFSPSYLVGIYQGKTADNDHTWLRFTFTGEILSNVEPSPRDADILRAFWMSEVDIRSDESRIRSPQVLAGLDDYNAGQRFSLDLLRELR